MVSLSLKTVVLGCGAFTFAVRTFSGLCRFQDFVACHTGNLSNPSQMTFDGQAFSKKRVGASPGRNFSL